ncbi:hypothetical protein L596_011396 [Steinernema carpocapsae]|nr:hypothetical protein L596_011396 [Steinernema carpocapsae]
MPGFAEHNFPLYQPNHSYYDYMKHSERSAPHPYESPVRKQLARTYRKRDDLTSRWLLDHRRGPIHHGSPCRPGSTVSSWNGSHASHASRLSTASKASRLTILTDIDVNCVLLNLSNGCENIDPMGNENALRQLIYGYSNLNSSQQEGLLRRVMKSASTYCLLPSTDSKTVRSSQLGAMVDREMLKSFLGYLVMRSDEFLPMGTDGTRVSSSDYPLLKAIWKTFCYLVRCDVFIRLMFQINAEGSLVRFVLNAIRRDMMHTPYAIQVFKRLLASRHGTQFLQKARLVESMDRLVAYLPFCEQMQTPNQSTTASGNKVEVIECLRILLEGTPSFSDPNAKKNLQAIRSRFLELGGMSCLEGILKASVEEPVLTATTAVLKTIMRGTHRLLVAEQIIAGGSIRSLASLLNHASPPLIHNCLHCLAAVSDRSEALLKVGESMEAVIKQVINVMGSSRVDFDECASVFLLNTATVKQFKPMLIRNGAVRVLLQIVNKRAFGFFVSSTDIEPFLHKSYIESIENSVRTLAQLSNIFGDNSATRVFLGEFCVFENLLKLLGNISIVTSEFSDFSESSPMSAVLRRRASVSPESRFQIRRHVLMLLERNLPHLRFRNLLKSSPNECALFADSSLNLLYEVNAQWLASKTTPILAKRFESILRTVIVLSKASEFSNGFTASLQSQLFVGFIASLQNHSEITQIQVLQFFKGLPEPLSQALPLLSIQDIVDSKFSNNSDVRNMADELFGSAIPNSGQFLDYMECSLDLS